MKILSLFRFVLLLAIITPPLAAEELTEQRFQQLLRELKPSESAVWRSIPWKISLLDAQQVAATENKPIFIWAMDGHPLGCT